MNDGILNYDMEFNTAPAEVRKAFLGQQAQKRLFQPGHEFYKFTHYPLFKPDGTITSWWSSVEPLAGSDPGLKGSLERAQHLGVVPEDFARARTAVTRQWNRMSNLLRVRLFAPVYGFTGRCSGQRVDEDTNLANVFFIGGAYQVWIPHLTGREMVQA